MQADQDEDADDEDEPDETVLDARDAETFDDGEFYQQLLKEFLEGSGVDAAAVNASAQVRMLGLLRLRCRVISMACTCVAVCAVARKCPRRCIGLLHASICYYGRATALGWQRVLHFCGRVLCWIVWVLED